VSNLIGKFQGEQR